MVRSFTRSLAGPEATRRQSIRRGRRSAQHPARDGDVGRRARQKSVFSFCFKMFKLESAIHTARGPAAIM